MNYITKNDFLNFELRKIEKNLYFELMDIGKIGTKLG